MVLHGVFIKALFYEKYIHCRLEKLFFWEMACWRPHQLLHLTVSSRFLAGSRPHPHQARHVANSLTDICLKGLIYFPSLHWILLRILRDNIFIKRKHQEYLNYTLKCSVIILMIMYFWAYVFKVTFVGISWKTTCQTCRLTMILSAVTWPNSCSHQLQSDSVCPWQTTLLLWTLRGPQAVRPVGPGLHVSLAVLGLGPLCLHGYIY